MMEASGSSAGTGGAVGIAGPIGPDIGAELYGLDVAAGLDEAQMRSIRDAVLRYSVVVLRHQRISPAQQLAFARRLGEVPAPASRAGGFKAPFLPEHPELLVVSNIVEDGAPIGISDAGLLWHSDTCFQSNPELFATLYAIEIPVSGDTPLGVTRWVDAAAAYDALDPDMKRRLEGLRVIQSYAYHLDLLDKHGLLTRLPITDPEMRALSEVSHPVVRTHPITGRKLLYVNESFSERIESLAPDEGRELIDQLCAHITAERFMHRHEWQVGDLLIWDNCATQHLASFDYGTMRRRLHRCGTVGPVPE